MIGRSVRATQKVTTIEIKKQETNKRNEECWIEASTVAAQRRKQGKQSFENINV